MRADRVSRPECPGSRRNPDFPRKDACGCPHGPESVAPRDSTRPPPAGPFPGAPMPRGPRLVGRFGRVGQKIPIASSPLPIRDRSRPPGERVEGLACRGDPPAVDHRAGLQHVLTIATMPATGRRLRRARSIPPILRRLPDDAENLTPDRLRQHRPDVYDQGQGGVQWGRIARKCVGIRVALSSERRFPRGIRPLFDSPWVLSPATCRPSGGFLFALSR